MKKDKKSISPKFTKKVFSFGLLLSDIGFLLFHIPGILAAMRNEEIGKPFMEKIMMVVTAVNGCVYCTWFHAKKARSSGISEEEVRNMLRLQFKTDASDFETTGLLYAQHYAETNRKPDSEMTEQLYTFYGEKTARHIILLIRMIFFGNLYGNTFDAFPSRMKGIKPENSCFLFELYFFLFNLPFMLPLLPAVKKYRQGAPEHST